MIRLQNVVRLAALGSMLTWSGASLAQPNNRPRHDPRPDRFFSDLDENPFNEVLFYFGVPDSDSLGITFEPADESVRSQLGIPEGRGLVVTSVAEGGPASRIGLRKNDILMTFEDKPLATATDLSNALKSAGDKTSTLHILREGKPASVEVKPESHGAFDPHVRGRSQYQLGVQTRPLDDTLRAHLGIPEQRGVLVRRVEPGTAAEKAGLKMHDILLEVGDQPLDGTEELVRQIQKSAGKAMTFKVLRGGKDLTIEVTPELRKALELGRFEDFDEPSILAIRPSGAVRLPRTLGASVHLPFHADRQLGELRDEVRQLRRAIEKLQKSFPSKPDSTPEEKR